MTWIILFIILVCVGLWIDAAYQKNKIKELLEIYFTTIQATQVDVSVLESIREQIRDWKDVQ